MHAPIRGSASAAELQPGNVGLRRFSVACEVRCGILPQLFWRCSAVAEQTLVRFAVPVESPFGVAALALRQGLFPEPPHVVEQGRLAVPAFVHIGNATVADERIKRSPILADALGIKTHGLRNLKVFLGSSCHRERANRCLRCAYQVALEQFKGTSAKPLSQSTFLEYVAPATFRNQGQFEALV